MMGMHRERSPTHRASARKGLDWSKRDHADVRRPVSFAQSAPAKDIHHEPNRLARRSRRHHPFCARILRAALRGWPSRRAMVRPVQPRCRCPPATRSTRDPLTLPMQCHVGHATDQIWRPLAWGPLTFDNSLGRESSDHGIPRPPNAKVPHELPSSIHRHPAVRRPVRPFCLRRQGRTNVGCAHACTCTCTCSRRRNGHARPAARSHRRGPDGRRGRGRSRRTGLRI